MTEQGPDGLSRRTVIKRAGVGMALVWTAPVLTSVSAPAFAGTPQPHPECAGSSCGKFSPCSSTNPDCVCVAVEGGGLCVPGNTTCASVPTCNPGDPPCPPGHTCSVATCCPGAVCIPHELANQCPPGEPARATARAMARVSSGAGTIGG